MLAPDEVAAMVRLQGLGWGTKRIAGELGCSRNTVRRYLAAGGWVPLCQPRRRRRLDGLDEWLVERFRRHRGNCEVVRQDLAREHGMSVSLRTVERAVAPLRQGLRAEARACLRFETPPGKQLQIDFGATTVSIGGAAVRVHLFVRLQLAIAAAGCRNGLSDQLLRAGRSLRRAFGRARRPPLPRELRAMPRRRRPRRRSRSRNAECPSCRSDRSAPRWHIPKGICSGGSVTARAVRCQVLLQSSTPRVAGT